MDDQMDAYLEGLAQDAYDDAVTRGWPGDGSGEDDLSDLMATGDEGCYDRPEDY